MNLDDRHIFGAHDNYRIDYVNNPKQEAAVKFKDITKRYRDYKSDGQKLLMLFSKKLRRNIPLDTHLNKVTLTISKGEYVNVCGSFPKSRGTFCDLTRGTVYPDFGHLWINGTVSSVKSMKSELVMFLSMEENLMRISRLHQMKAENVSLMLEQVLDFAGVSERKAKEPLKKLTQKSVKRLKATYYLHAPYDILIMDEDIPKVDSEFTERCDARMREMLDKGSICVIRPSQVPIIKGKFVTRTLLFGETKPIYDGDADKAMEIYKKMEEAVIEAEAEDDGL
jgi:ABC-type polysaccharide/polyol phosphate transport system ATPase subunit